MGDKNFILITEFIVIQAAGAPWVYPSCLLAAFLWKCVCSDYVVGLNRVIVDPVRVKLQYRLPATCRQVHQTSQLEPA